MIYTVYAEKDDMTFVMYEDEQKIQVVGFYFGQPDDEATETFKGKMDAEKEE